MPRTPVRPRRRDDGAVALEFALIAPMVLMILFGVLTYGLWLNDMLNLRQGVREASRQAAVNNFGTVSSCGATWSGTAPTPDIAKLVCLTKANVTSVTGTTYVKVLLPSGWVRGGQVVVCTQIRADRIGSPVPLPNDDIIRAVSRMSIEEALPGQVEVGGAEVPPTGGSWSWCA